MLLRTKIRKFQLGASLNQAQNAYAPIDIRWKEFDLSGFKQSPLNIPKGPGSTGSGSTSTSDDGLPSDVEYVNTQMSNAKEKLRTRLSASDAKDYTATTEYKNDMAEINKWAQAKASMLKARADDYKTTKTRLQKAAGDDLAIFNGQGLAMDNTDGQYKIVSADDILTERTQAGKGLAPRYTPANVSTALQLRLSDPEFSGFNEGKGDKLEKILYSVSDAETVNKEMTDLFSKAGSINESNSTFVNNKTGASTSISELMKNLNAVSQTSAKGFKTNEPNLIDAINVFKQNVSPVHLDALRNNAISKFIQLNGSKQVNTADANDWVDAQVDAAIANRAKVFLTKATSNKSGTSTSGGGAGGTDLSKRHLATNKIKFAEINPGEPMTMETGYEDATDLTDHMSKFNVMGKVYATRKDIKENIKEGAGGTAVKPGTAYTLDTNDYVSRLAGGDLQNNLFLADDSSTPVNDLNDKNGLSTSIVNVTPSGGQMKIMHSMPYRVDPKTGKYSIAWKDLGKAIALLLLGLIGLHLVGVFVGSRLLKEPLVRPMVTGWKPGFPLSAPRSARPLQAALLLALIGGLFAWGIPELAKRPAFGVPAMPPNQVMIVECGACHRLFHPSLLPRASWAKLMADLGDHFGEDASLSPAKQQEIAAYLSTYAAEVWDTKAAHRFAEVDPANPISITATPGWQRIHARLDPAVFTRHGIGSKGNCGACHKDADGGRFDPQAISVPQG